MRSKSIIIASLLCLTGLHVAAQTTLTEESFKNRVIEYSQSIKSEKAEAIAMKKAMQAAKTAYLPAVNGYGSFQYALKDRNYGIPTTTIFFPMEREDFSLGAELTQPIYAGGAIRSKVKSAKIQSEMADIKIVHKNVAYSAVLAYWGAAAQKEMYNTMERYVNIISQLRDIVNVRYEEGKISKTDLIQTESRLSEAKLQLADSRLSYKLALQNMNYMMGQDPYTPIELQSEVSSCLELPAAVNPADVLNLRPEMAIAKLNVLLQEQQIKSVASQYNPSLYAGITTGWGSSPMNVDNTGYWSHALYVKLSVPVFNWGARYKSVSAQRAMLDSKKFALQAQVDDISQQVTDSWTKIAENISKIDISEQNVAIADENLDLNTFSYNEGKLTILDVLSAQASWITAYTNMISAWYAQHTAIADYMNAITE